MTCVLQGGRVIGRKSTPTKIQNDNDKKRKTIAIIIREDGCADMSVLKGFNGVQSFQLRDRIR